MRRKTVFPALLLAALFLLLSACTAAGRKDADTTYYRVTFYQDGEALTWKRLAEGSVIRLVPQTTQEGSTITRWIDAEYNFVEPDGMIVTGDMDFYVFEAPALDTDAHVAYMGESDSLLFFPNATLSRAEAAQILYTLLDKSQLPETASLTDDLPTFSDVDEDSEYYTAIQTLISRRMMRGYPDGTFRPEETITRAEFVSMLAGYAQVVHSDGTDFTDVPADYWAADAIAAAVKNGWLEGFSDGCFYPDRALTRAEAVAIINRMMGYNVDARAIDESVPQGQYMDVSADYWAYYDIMDATNTNELLSYVRGEVQAEPGFIYLGDKLYHVNDQGTLDYYEAGFQEIDGQLRYCSESGYSIDEFSTGVVDLDGAMYYVDSDGSFCRNSYRGYLYFGDDGRYTSGSEYLDAQVEAFLDGILYDESMSQYEKLYAAYQRVKNRFGYINWGDGYAAGTSDWAQSCAIVMFDEERGHCYYWAAAYMYLCRRLGYQAYCVAGIAGTLGSWHAWVMIDWSDGSEYLFDPELEWSYERGYLDGYVQHRDLFMQPFYSTGTLYTFADGSHTTQR